MPQTTETQTQDTQDTQETRETRVWLTLKLSAGTYDVPAVVVKRDGWGPTVYRQTDTGTLRCWREVLMARER